MNYTRSPGFLRGALLQFIEFYETMCFGRTFHGDRELPGLCLCFPRGNDMLQTQNVWDLGGGNTRAPKEGGGNTRTTKKQKVTKETHYNGGGE